MRTSTLKTDPQTPRSKAIDTVFEHLCMLVDASTDPLDYNRFTIIAIHQSQNYAVLINDFDLLHEINSMEARWFRGEI